MKWTLALLTLSMAPGVFSVICCEDFLGLPCPVDGFFGNRACCYSPDTNVKKSSCRNAFPKWRDHHADVYENKILVEKCASTLVDGRLYCVA
ncbi:hypothetical protein PTNB73_05068 [Pyrenophora teres f. teres]|uniref:Uncharacterized protein n=1 Tax=Pyrenophora teres f. teres TaxID=97479 RepID=A0A6S6W0C9_9PLEO|nr:hypothetical protein HRS9139_05364 [Pyrenophora teres f. teres]CAA9961222.1 hypothetical protein PTMSG1_04606 [Pyrenophora teres f. maculata]KAE8840687.1 hypothetical protein PTNB85_04086 [Pyrenophora teres f. teres]KAE8849174.1 hypothetical protein HRS9122_03190 [Pyrenophora teres f. teres]KAE8864182.1 hypothetical protein PTNB29_04146 [Pyrenophora teres f. teres]